MELLSQHISTKSNSRYKDKKLKLNEDKRELSAREAAQLIWHSFRFSNGNAALQFTMLLQAWEKYWNQEISVDEVFDELKKLLKVWKKHTKSTTYENKNPRPPHPRFETFTTETHTDIALSQADSHKAITSSYISESDSVIQMLLSGEWRLRRMNRDGDYYISAKREYLSKWWIIQGIFEADFKYLLNTNWQWNYEWRPNRKPENDGSNNLKDRFFSYFVWFCLRSNTTGNSFFDEYFKEIQNFFTKWFAGLPSDSELLEKNKQEREKSDWYRDRSPLRKDKYWYSTQITKEDVLLLIAQYNATHPDTQVSMTELWLSEFPQYRSALLKDS